MDKKLLTAVIPLRLSPEVYEATGRLAHIINTIPDDIFDILIVDYGSSEIHRKSLCALEKQSNVRVYYHAEAVGNRFSIGHARDLGAEHATTPVILFHDIDFICTGNMYRRIHTETINRQIASNRTNDFFCVPMAFLNERGNSAYKQCISTTTDLNTDNQLQHLIISDSKAYCESVVYGSSAIVVNRYHYLSIGGHHRDFSGHGAEDYDILHRLSYYNPKAPRSSDYYSNLRDSSFSEYAGFRSYFALHGMDVFMKGIFMLHLYHPPRPIADYRQFRQNLLLLQRVMIKFDNNKRQPMPLRDRSSPKKTLVLSKEDNYFTDALRRAIPAMGEVAFIDEATFTNPDDLILHLKNNHFTHLGFKNPYGNPHRLNLYQRIRESHFSYWVFDRGALPNSWFFDPNGFNADSTSYHGNHWDKPLSLEEQDKARQFIDDLCQGSEALEKNGSRVDEDRLRKQLNVGDRKVVFVPFQRPTDSVCKYFSGNAESAEGFNKIVSALSEMLDDNHWIIVGKKHPLEAAAPDIPKLTFADNDTHVHDLLSLADYVVVLNSGVGLLASLFDKPTIYLGDAFYGHEGINHYAKDAAGIVDLLSQDIKPDKTLVERFTYHLTDRVYSFGASSYTEVTRKEDGGKLSLVNNILFENIRGLSQEPITIGLPIPELDLDEALFFSFGGRKAISNARQTPGDVLSSFSMKQRWIIKTFSFVTQPILTSNLKAKLRNDPERFFRDSNNKFSRWVSKQLNMK